MNSKQIDRVISNLLKLPPAQWQVTFDRLAKKHPASVIYDLGRALSDTAGRCAWLAEYAESRGCAYGSPLDHKDAAKRARRCCLKVNKALGYSYPELRGFAV